ncbi:hypothetical protein [Isobaculum melis]|uniref:LXG domain of WXG superfamily protein n=1 Tax=Isobaculum melis TaxID=142588 RepID=A0A1H9PQJ2_9LACT|nr:hypothetical protein [Isobaculum melis]SER50512.1 LXG domain of WXG superfamily protein [Isobaculum melis]
MSLNMFLSEANGQKESVAVNCRETIIGMERIQQAIHQFVLEPSLTGKTYETAKNYFLNGYLPVTKGFILVSETMMNACETFVSRYESEVDVNSLQEDVLVSQIERYNQLSYNLENIDEPDAYVKTMIVSMQAMKQTTENKLNRLREYEVTSSAIFDELEHLLINLESGVRMLAEGKAWNAFSGTYSLTGLNMEWATNLNQSWKNREEKRNQHTYEIRRAPTKYMNYYQLFVDGVLDEEATKAYNELLTEKTLDDLKNILNRSKEVIDAASFLIGNTIKLVGGATTVITGIVGTVGGVTVVTLASGGTAIVVDGAIIATGSAVTAVGGVLVTDAWGQLQNPGDHYQFSNNGKITSKTFGKPIEATIGNKKHKLRVDAEPDGNKIQIQSGSGKNSPIDDRIRVDKITDKASIEGLIDNSIKKKLSKGKLDELINNIWKAFVWLTTK